MARKVYEISFNIGGRLASSFRGTFSHASSVLRTLKEDSNQVKAKIRELEKAYRNGAISAGTYEAAHARLSNQLQRTQEAQKRLNQAIQNQNEAIARSNEIRGQILDTAVMATPFFAAARQAMMFEDAMLGVAKQAEGARDETGKLTPIYYQMRKEIQMLGREIPIATNELAGLVESGLRMGVARDQILHFTREIAKMATAFEVPPAEIGEHMGKIAGLYKIPIPSIGELADSINYLDDNTISKGGDIIDFLLRTGGSASSVRITGKEMAALGSTLLTLGERSETAGTAVNAMFSKLAAADKGTKKFKEAMKEIGLSTADIQSGMQVDATGTLIKVMEAIGKLKGEKQLGVMVELVGLEHSDTLSKLVNGISEFRRQLELANSEAAKGSMSKEFAARLQTTSAQLQLMKNSATETAVALGTVLLPTLNQIFGGIAKASQAAAEFAEKYPTVTNVLVMGAAGLVGARLGWLALRFAWNQATATASGVKLAIEKITALQARKQTQTLLLAGAINRMTIAQRLLNVAMKANAIGLVITGLVYLYENFESVRNIVNKVWEAFKNTFPNAAKWIENVVSKAGELYRKFKEFIGLGGSNKSTGVADLKMVDMPGYANGGFAMAPQVATLAERVPEAIIPLDGSKRSVSLWKQTGDALGMTGGGNTEINLTYSPTIYVSDKSDIEPTLRQDRQNLLDELRSIAHQQRRVAYG